jgi:phospholipid-binding lipoprotein MlaA
MRPTISRQALIFLFGFALFTAAAAAGEPAAVPTAAPAAAEPAVATAAPAAVEPAGVTTEAPAPAEPGFVPTAAPVTAGAALDPLLDDDASDDYAAELGALVPDPIEPLNRSFFRFNDALDQWVLDPVTRGYQFVVPSPVRLCIRRFFRNLKAPVYVVNDLLQLRFRDAAETAAGFALNSTAGFVGLFDPGENVGWHQHAADFGQTLGVFGVPSGPYLVIPIFGPTTVRDGTGDLVDRAFDPLTYIFGMGDLIFIGGSSGFVTREENAQAIEALRASSVDYYSAMRSAYTQNREGRIAELRARLGFGRKSQQTAHETPQEPPQETAAAP